MELTEDKSNQIFETLASWNTVLEACQAPYEEFTPD